MAFPHLPNIDLAGVITQVGEGVSGWSVGDAVAALLPMTTPAAAEYVAAPAHTLAAAPRTIEAVGGYAVQLATRAGAAVTATASPRGLDRIRSYGADPSSTPPPPPSWRRWPGSASTWC